MSLAKPVVGMENGKEYAVMIQEEASSNQKEAKSFWQVWGSFIIICIVCVLVGVAFLLVLLFCPVSEWLAASKKWIMENLGVGITVYLLTVIFLTLILCPMTLVEIFGVMIVGPYIGFGLNLAGNMIGGVIAFFFARRFLVSWIHNNQEHSRIIQLVVKTIEHHEFKAILAIQFLYIPGGLKNYMIGAIPQASFWIFFIAKLICTVIFSALFSVVGAMATNIVDLIKKPNVAEWVMIGFGILAVIAVVILLYYVSKKLFDDMEKESEETKPIAGEEEYSETDRLKSETETKHD